jgi:hypothetical protein
MIQTHHVKIIQNFNTLSGSKFSTSLIMFVISAVLALIDMVSFKSGMPSQANSGSLSGIILVPLASFVIGFIPLLGGLGMIVFLCLSVASLQEPSLLPRYLCLLAGIVSGITCRKSIRGATGI